MSASSGKSLDVVALGEAMLEFNQTQAEPPLYLQGFGGDTSNAAIASARAGARVAYLSRLGQDHWGHLLMQPADVQAHWSGLISRSRWLHLSGISLAISPSACDTALAALALARQSGTRIALDANLRLSLWPLERARACMAEAVRLCDLFLPSLDEMADLTGLQDPEAVLDCSHAHGARQVVLKLGADGAIVSEQGQRTRLAPLRVQEVDATGAGDCFAGNLLARLCAGDSLPQAALYANAAAALSVQGRGAVAPLPFPEAVQALLRP